MLLQFEVRGFKGFSEPFCWNLAARDYTFNNRMIRNHIISKAIVLDESRPGKEELRLALFDVYYHLIDSSDIPETYLQDYLNTAKATREATFRYTFQFDKDLVVYEYAKKSATRILYEKMWINGTQVLDTAGKINGKAFRSVSAVVYNGPELQPDPSYPSFVDQIYQALPETDDSPLTRMVRFIEGMAQYESLTTTGLVRSQKHLQQLEAQLIAEGQPLVLAFEAHLKANHYPYHLSVSQKPQILCFQEGKETPRPFSLSAPFAAREQLLFFLWTRRALGQISFMYMEDFDTICYGRSAEATLNLLFNNRTVQMVIVTHNTHLIRNDLVRPDAVFLRRDNELTPLYKRTNKEIRVALNLEKMYWDGAFDDPKSSQ